MTPASLNKLIRTNCCPQPKKGGGWERELMFIFLVSEQAHVIKLLLLLLFYYYVAAIDCDILAVAVSVFLLLIARY